MEQYGKKPVLFAGGVMSNRIIRDYFTGKYQACFAKPEFSSDNAGGIAVLWQEKWRNLRDQLQCFGCKPVYQTNTIGRGYPPPDCDPWGGLPILPTIFGLDTAVLPLKDQNSALKCVMFKSNVAHLRFMPENGMQVIALGDIQVFERDGVYQLYCTDIQPDGAGALAMAFEQLKQKLAKEGLFDPERKKPLQPSPIPSVW